MARSVSIRTSLLSSVGLLIATLAVAIVGLTAWAGNQLVEAASQRVTDRALDRCEAELKAFFTLARHNLEMARGWLERGALDSDDGEQMVGFFLPLMESFDEVSAVHVGDAEGRSWILLRRDGDWLSRRTDPIAFGPRIRLRSWTDDGRMTREWWIDDPKPGERYDPRTREWYRNAVQGAARHEADAEQPRRVYWTEPYVFFTSGEPGLTGAVHVDTPTGRILLAFDVRVQDVSAFTRDIEVTPSGFATVLTEDGRMLGVPRHPTIPAASDVRSALLARPDEIGLEILDDVFAARAALVFPDRPTPEDVTVFRFLHGGERWWADVRAVSVPPERRYLAVVTVPEGDLAGPIGRLRNGVVLVACVALLASIGSAWWLARSYSAPLSSLARDSTRIRRLDLQAGEPVRSSITEIAQLAGAQESMRATVDAFSRYVPTDVVRELLELGAVARIGGERKSLTVLFSDIVGFTGIAEHKSPEALTAHLAVYFDELLPILEQDGTVDKLVGDGIMAFWGAPLPDSQHARHAVEAVIGCQRRVEELNRRWQTAGEPPLPTRFGLATGPALVGNVGSPRRLSYTAVGDVVNLASRLEGLNRLYGTSVLAAAPVPRLAGSRFAWRELDRVRVVGRGEAVAVYELLGHAGSVEPGRMAFAGSYAKALDAFRERAFAVAIAELDALADPWRADASVVRLRAACEGFAAMPPPDDWDAVTLLERK